jgi:septal ring factor EnvC (AmiA/AmiB activator)
MSYPVDPEKISGQLAVLKDELKEKDEEIRRLKTELAASNAATQAAQEDANANKFMCSLQEQRIEELEQQSSRDQLDRNEALSDKTRKHKQVIKKLNQDRAAYEERADKMIKQMNEQMTQLQQMAMSRIEVLNFPHCTCIFPRSSFLLSCYPCSDSRERLAGSTPLQ